MAQFGWDDEEKKDTEAPESPKEELLIDPALRSSTKPVMATRRHLPSPPAAIMPPSHSPSPSVASVDRSSSNISTPPVRRSPPPMHAPPPPPLFSSYHHDIRQHHHPDSHFQPRADMHHGYLYAPPPPPQFDHRYADHHHHHHPYHTASGIPTHFAAVPAMAHPSSYPSHGPSPYPQPGQPPVTVIHTDDAATKLSDRVRRRCFNCCTTDTSTWRRSNLSPGKVLCNKCGLFERTHSRPRPEQFPHKRGPLATTSLQRRTPPAQQGQPQQQQHQGYPPPPGSTHLPPIAPPYQYSHPSIAPLDHRRDHLPPPNGLPGLQSWHNANTSNGSSTNNNNGSSGGGGGSGESGSASGSPHMVPLSSRRSGDNGSNAGSRLPTPPPSLSRSVNTSQESSSAREGSPSQE